MTPAADGGGPCRAAAGTRPLPHGPADRRPAGADGRIGARRSAHRGRRWLVAAVRQPVDGAKKIVNLLGGFARIGFEGDVADLVASRSSSTVPRAPASSSTAPSTRWSASRSRTDALGSDRPPGPEPTEYPDEQRRDYQRRTLSTTSTDSAHSTRRATGRTSAGLPPAGPAPRGLRSGRRPRSHSSG
jgi:hypothetical protein